MVDIVDSNDLKAKIIDGVKNFYKTTQESKGFNPTETHGLLQNNTLNSTIPASTQGFSVSLYRQWLAMEILTCVLALFTSYLIVSLMVYHKKKYTMNAQNLPNAKKGVRYHVFDWLTILTAVLALARLFFGLDTIWGRGDTFNCTTLKRVRLLSGILCYWITYMILWYRQRIIYNKPTLASLTTKFTRFLSVASIVIICVTFLFWTVVYLLTGNYEATPNGCVFHGESKLARDKWFGIIPCSGVFMTMLLVLFILPVIKQRRDNAASNISHMANERSRLVRRALVATVITIVTDAVANLLIAFVDIGVDEFSNFMTDCNLSVNLVCTIHCFSDWRKRLFPWSIKKKAEIECATESRDTAEASA